ETRIGQCGRLSSPAADYLRRRIAVPGQDGPPFARVDGRILAPEPLPGSFQPGCGWPEPAAQARDALCVLFVVMTAGRAKVWVLVRGLDPKRSFLSFRGEKIAR